MIIQRKNGETFGIKEMDHLGLADNIIGYGVAEIRGTTINNPDGSQRICGVRFEGTNEFVDVVLPAGRQEVEIPLITENGITRPVDGFVESLVIN